jgi:hypothetical protein
MAGRRLACFDRNGPVLVDLLAAPVALHGRRERFDFSYALTVPRPMWDRLEQQQQVQERNREQFLQAFGEGLNTVKDVKSFFQLSGLSILIWVFIGFAYMAVTHAYSIHRLSKMTLSSVFLLTAASVVGGVLQLPVVGGGSQLATIGMLRGVFNLPPELAISCGIMLWLTTFMSVVPAGLAMARSEHVSITQMEEASLEEERAVEESADRDVG